jgi:hypothetical protein
MREIEKLREPGSGGGAVAWYTITPATMKATMSSNSRFPIDLAWSL